VASFCKWLPISFPPIRAMGRFYLAGKHGGKGD
jgi:hypothetical protein